jgi:flagella basal body P-ring formation protein FlgA
MGTGMMNRVMLVAMLLFAAASSLGQSVIELRPSARVAAGAPVVVGDIARLEGEDAVVLGTVVVLEGAKAGERVTIDEVRRAVDRSGRVNWGRISLRGSACTLAAMESDARPAEATPAGSPAAAPDPAGTVRHAVMMRIAAVAQAPIEDLRLAFSPDDDEILNLHSAGRTVEVTPTGLSDRLPLAVRVFEGERIVRSRTIRVGVEVRREVVMGGASRRRGETIGDEDVTRGVQWLGLSARPARLDQVVGASPRMRVNVGQVVMVDDVTPQVVVNKGEQVTVYCVSGTVVLTMRARATAPARDGELVVLEALDSKRTFQARMDGRGRAVVNVDGGRGQ